MGIAVAVSAVADVSYLAEVAPKGLRGAMVSTNELAISIGMLTAFLTGHLLRNVHGKDFYVAAGNRSASVSSPLNMTRLCTLMHAYARSFRLSHRRPESAYQ